MDLEELYRNNYNSYVKAYRNRCGSVENAEDVVQEAFTRALTYWSSYNPDMQKLDIWFSRVLSNAYKDWRTDDRNGGLVRELEDKDDVAAEEKNKDSLAPLIQKWPHKEQREVLYLYYVMGYKSREVSYITDYTHMYVRKILNMFVKSL